MPFSGISVTLNGNTYNDASFLADGHQTNFLAALSDWLEEADAVHADADAATNAALLAQTAGGFPYVFESTTTAADPGTGKLKFNHATLASATVMYISETTSASQAIAALIATWDDSTSTIRGMLRVFKRSDLTTYAIFSVTGSNTDSGTYDAVNVSYVAGNGTFADDDEITIQFIRNGDKGDTGATGAPGSAYTDEQAQDAAFSIFGDSTTLDATYNDGAGTFSVEIKSAAVTFAMLAADAKRSWHGTFIEAPVDGTYLLCDSLPFAGTIKNVRSICAAGTTTATSKINSTALGGTANSVSSTVSVQAHSSTNTFSVGDDLNVTLASTTGCSNIFLYYEIERS